jgi:hypothetical protein
LHHRDIIGVALRRMEEQLRSPQAPEVLTDVVREVSHRQPDSSKIPSPNGAGDVPKPAE